ncbi:MAG TPA: hypothetical protein DEO43_00110 [Halieaceae bacterium]|nr:hypothetical protein [Halieaceae bacterium]
MIPTVFKLPMLTDEAKYSLDRRPILGLSDLCNICRLMHLQNTRPSLANLSIKVMLLVGKGQCYG